MRYILFISLLFISCSKTVESDFINKVDNSISETELLSEEFYEIYLLEELDESRGYCIDIKGSKLNADPDNGLQAHTCYSYQGEVSVDQSFDNTKIEQDEFYIPYFDVCMEAESASESSNLLLKPCNKSEKQKFEFKSTGEIVLANNTDLCLTVSEVSREGGGGSPVHLIRDLVLNGCNNNISTRQKWGLRKSQ